MSLEEKIVEFDSLVLKAAKIHKFTWCVRLQCSIPTLFLRGERCCRCSEFVLNNGVCDPL